MPLSYRRCTYSRKNEISAAVLIRSFTVNAEGQHTSQSHLNPQTIWKLSWDARNLACSLHSNFLEIKWGQERMGYTRRTRLCFLSPTCLHHSCSWVLSCTHNFQAKIAFINEFRKKREYWILDSLPWSPDSSNLALVFVSGTIRFCMLIISGIPDSLSCILDSKAQDSEFYQQNFPRFQIP